MRKGEKEYFTHSCVQNMALEALKKLVTLVPIWKTTQQLGGSKKRDFKTIFFIIYTFVYFCIVWLCMCVDMHMGTNVCGKVHIRVRSCMWRPKVDIACFP